MSKEIPLSQGKFALVNDKDFEELNKYKWHAQKHLHTFYAKRGKTKTNPRQPFMHRFILRTPDNMDTDHIDGNGLNNQRNNLRICTHSENMSNIRVNKLNSSGYGGVYLNKKSGKYYAQLRFNGNRIFIGSFSSPREAAKAYNKKAKELRGDFAQLNTIKEENNNE